MSISFMMLLFTIFFIFISFKTDYMNCKDILIKHFNMFRMDDGTIPIILIFTYIILPFLTGLVLSIINVINKDVVGMLTVIITILTSMLFTLLIMVIDIKNKFEIGSNDSDIVKEVYYSIMFEIFISILILISLLTFMFSYKCIEIKCFFVLKNIMNIDYVAKVGYSIMIYGLSFLLLVNLFIILKRVFILINKTIEKDN